MTLTFTESFTEFKRLIKTQFPNSQWNYMNISADINKKFPQHTVKKQKCLSLQELAIQIAFIIMEFVNQILGLVIINHLLVLKS